MLDLILVQDHRERRVVLARVRRRAPVVLLVGPEQHDLGADGLIPVVLLPGRPSRSADVASKISEIGGRRAPSRWSAALALLEELRVADADASASYTFSNAGAIFRGMPRYAWRESRPPSDSRASDEPLMYETISRKTMDGFIGHERTL